MTRESGVPTGIIRLLPLSGVLAVALQAIAFVVMGIAGYRPRGDDAVAIFGAAPERIEAGALIGGFYALVFLLIFAGSVAGAIRTYGGDARLAAIALAGGITATIALAMGYRILNAAAFQARGPDGISAELATFSYRLYASTFAGFVSFGLAAFLGATGVSALRTRMLPASLAWVGVVTAVVLMTPAHGIAEGVALAWMVTVSIVLTVQRVPGDAVEHGPIDRVDIHPRDQAHPPTGRSSG